MAFCHQFCLVFDMFAGCIIKTYLCLIHRSQHIPDYQHHGIFLGGEFNRVDESFAF
mgnify:CR=1 FL=1